MEDYILNISPIDGRYKEITKEVKKYFSEYYLIKNRILVEIEWVKKLSKIKELEVNITTRELRVLDKIVSDFDINEAKRVKEI